MFSRIAAVAAVAVNTPAMRPPAAVGVIVPIAVVVTAPVVGFVILIETVITPPVKPVAAVS